MIKLSYQGCISIVMHKQCFHVLKFTNLRNLLGYTIYEMNESVHIHLIVYAHVGACTSITSKNTWALDVMK